MGAGRPERSNGASYGRLINGERGGYLGYAMWRRYLKLAHGYTAAHPDGIVNYTAHELRHVCACAKRSARRSAHQADGGGCRGLLRPARRLSARWLLTVGQRRRLTPAVTGALAAGWTPAALAEVTGVNNAGIRSPADTDEHTGARREIVRLPGPRCAPAFACP